MKVKINKKKTQQNLLVDVTKIPDFLVQDIQGEKNKMKLCKPYDDNLITLYVNVCFPVFTVI
jgi:hypothetical protein